MDQVSTVEFENRKFFRHSGWYIIVYLYCFIIHKKRAKMDELTVIEGLEDADVVKEKKKMEETNLTQLFKENTLVVRYIHNSTELLVKF